MIRTAWRAPVVVLTAAVGLVAAPLPAQAAPGDPLWAVTEGVLTFGAAAGDSVVGADGTVFVVGSTAAPGGDFGLDWLIAAYRPDGSRLWGVRLSSPTLPQGTGGATAAALSPDGGQLYVTGGLAAVGGRDIAVAAFDTATGARDWLSRYDGPGGYDDAEDIAVDPSSGTIYVTGASHRAVARYDYLTMALRPDGSRLWLRRDGSPERLDDRARAIALDDAGNVYVTGSTDQPFALQFGTTLSYSPAGDLRWRERTSTSNGVQTNLTDILVDSARDAVYVTGWQRGGSGGTTTTYTAAHQLDGTPSWTANATHGNDRVAARMALDPTSGQVYVSSSPGPTNADVNLALTAYAPTGARLWTRGFGQPGVADVADDVAVDVASGQVFVTGTTGNSTRLTTLGFDDGGTRLWVRQFATDRAAAVHAYTISTDPVLHRVYVGGSLVESSTEGSLTLVAYTSV